MLLSMSSSLLARKMVRYSLWRVVFLSADRAASASMLAEYVFALGSACFGRDSACVVKSSMRRSLSAEGGGLEISKDDVETSRSSMQMLALVPTPRTTGAYLLRDSPRRPPAIRATGPSMCLPALQTASAVSLHMC